MNDSLHTFPPSESKVRQVCALHVCWEQIGFSHVCYVMGCSNSVMFSDSCELVNIVCLYCYRPDVRAHGVLLPWRRPYRQEQEM